MEGILLRIEGRDEFQAENVQNFIETLNRFNFLNNIYLYI